MRKKAIMALMLAAALVLAPLSGELAVTAQAEESVSDNDVSAQEESLSLGTVTCWWSDTKPGTICWTPVVEKADYCRGYRIYVAYKDAIDTNVGPFNGGYITGNILVSPETLEFDVMEFAASIHMDKRWYSCCVFALSSDTEAVANGKESDYTEYYYMDLNAESADSIIGSAMENEDAAQAVETVKQIPMASLCSAMQNDEDVLNQVQDLESRYTAQENITVNAPAVSETAARYVDAGKVSVVGAGLNAASGQSVGLEISIPEEAVETDYVSGGIQLDIRLTRDGESVSKPDIPVTITMPLPAGLDAEQLVILHYIDGSRFENLDFKCSGDGTVTFSVSSFSTFVFGQQKAADSDDEASDGSAGGNSDDDDEDGGSGGENSYIGDAEALIRDAAQGATVRITGLNTLSNGVMKALLARKDVTLVLEYTYEGKDYTVVIPAGAAVDNDIQWYGPLYLAGYYGNSGNLAAAGNIYTVQRGDTMSGIAKANHMTLAQLVAKNPQIKNINLILVGQRINL